MFTIHLKIFTFFIYYFFLCFFNLMGFLCFNHLKIRLFFNWNLNFIVSFYLLQTKLSLTLSVVLTSTHICVWRHNTAHRMPESVLWSHQAHTDIAVIGDFVRRQRKTENLQRTDRFSEIKSTPLYYFILKIHYDFFRQKIFQGIFHLVHLNVQIPQNMISFGGYSFIDLID